MAKKSKTNARKKAQAARAQTVSAQPAMSRRRMLSLARNGAIGVGVLGAVGYVGAGWYGDYLQEHDLTRIGQGKPAVVQIHDPQCAVCLALQHETRTAMKQFDEDDMLYLVADIKQAEGQAFAAQHNVSHVTLVLLDGQGQMVDVLRGSKSEAELAPLLKAHFRAHRSRG